MSDSHLFLLPNDACIRCGKIKPTRPVNSSPLALSVLRCQRLHSEMGGQTSREFTCGGPLRYVRLVQARDGYFDGMNSEAGCEVKNCVPSNDIHQTCVQSESGFSEIHLWKDREDRVVMLTFRETDNPEDEITVYANKYNAEELQSQQAQRVSLQSPYGYSVVFNFFASMTHSLTDIRVMSPSFTPDNETPILTDASDSSSSCPNNGGCNNRSMGGGVKGGGKRAKALKPAFPPKSRKRVVRRKPRALDVDTVKQVTRDYGSALAVVAIGFTVGSWLL